MSHSSPFTDASTNLAGRSSVPRRVVHMDLDCFYAAVEELEDPRLRDKPVAVVMGLDARGRGAVTTASYAARARGVRGAMPLAAARQCCPDLIVLPVRHALYRDYSRRVMAVLDDLSPIIQQISIDEAFAEVTGPGDVVDLARNTRDRIREEIGLSASFGIATSKLVAKIATSQGKPRGFVTVAPGQEAAFLAPLAVDALWGVGPRTGDRLRGLGIETLGQLAVTEPSTLASTFGPRRALELCRNAQGIDESPLDTDRRTKSISAEQTLGGEADPRRLWALYQEMASDVSHRLRQHRLQARTVGIKLRRGDWSLMTREQTLPQPVDDPERIAAVAAALMRAHWRRGTPLRLVGIRVSGLSLHLGAAQLPLFPDSPVP
ncbi:MAG TPA: DNA polymerase IV [Chloroflexota bacterium]